MSCFQAGGGHGKPGSMDHMSVRAKTPVSEQPEVLLPDAAAWRQWLVHNHETSAGIWLVLHKKGGNVTTLTAAQALDEALCFGWIDGQRGARDGESFKNRYTPRGAKSTWSARNVEYISRLREAGLMRPAGEAVVAAAQADGRWDAAYAGSATAELPAAFLAGLEEDPIAKATFESLPAAARFAYYFRLHNLKREETRTRKIAEYLNDLHHGRSI